jgi:hypothetical protein
MRNGMEHPKVKEELGYGSKEHYQFNEIYRF